MPDDIVFDPVPTAVPPPRGQINLPACTIERFRRAAVSVALAAALFGAGTDVSAQQMVAYEDDLPKLRFDTAGRSLGTLDLGGHDIELILEPDNFIGLATTRADALAFVTVLAKTYRPTALDIVSNYVSDFDVSEEMHRDHLRRRALEGLRRQDIYELPALDVVTQLPTVDAPGQSAAFLGDTYISNVVCGDYDSPSFTPALFDSAVRQQNFSYLGSHESGNGVVTSDRFFLILGPSTRGYFAICPTSIPAGAGMDDVPTLRVEERIGPDTWAQIENITAENGGFIFNGWAYGYRFSGVVLRQLRLSVDTRQVPAEYNYYWTGSY